MCEEEKKYIYDSIKNNEIDHQLIKSYIIANNISYSKNNNGIFINLSNIDKDILKPEDGFVILKKEEEFIMIN